MPIEPAQLGTAAHANGAPAHSAFASRTGAGALAVSLFAGAVIAFAPLAPASAAEVGWGVRELLQALSPSSTRATSPPRSTRAESWRTPTSRPPNAALPSSRPCPPTPSAQLTEAEYGEALKQAYGWLDPAQAEKIQSFDEAERTAQRRTTSSSL